jgi:hypothetical protein
MVSSHFLTAHPPRRIFSVLGSLLIVWRVAILRKYSCVAAVGFIAKGGIMPVTNMPPSSMGGPVLSRFLQAGDAIHQVVCLFYAKNRAKTHRFLLILTSGCNPGLLIFSSYGARAMPQKYRNAITGTIL